MVSLLRSGSVKTRFTALLTLGLSAVVYSAQPPALHAGVAPVYVVLQTYADRTQPIAPGVLSEASPSSIKGMLLIDLITTNSALNRLSSGVILSHDEMLKLHIILGL